MFCRQCGNKLGDDNQFCIKCGAKVNKPQQSPLPAKAPVSLSPAAPAAIPYTVPAASHSAPGLPAAQHPIPPAPRKDNTLKIVLIAGGAFAAVILLVIVVGVVMFIGNSRSNSGNDTYGNNENYDASPTYNDSNGEENYFDEDILQGYDDIYGDYPADIYGDYPAEDYAAPEQQNMCISCYGSGYCDTCKGTGQYSMYGNPLDTCPSCGGDGSCPICGGDG